MKIDDDALLTFATGFARRWQSDAPRRARRAAEEFAAAGDRDGVHAWGEVARLIEARRLHHTDARH